MDSKYIPTTSAVTTSPSTIVMPDEQYAVSQLRILRKKAEKSGAEIAKELRGWQDSLGHGKFKKNYILAGWTEGSVNHYFSYYQQHTDTDTEPDVVENKESPSSIQWFIGRLEKVIDTLDQILTEEKWQQDEDFPQLQQVGAKLAALLEKL